MKALGEGIWLDVLPLVCMPSSGRALRVGYGRAGEERGSSRPGPMNGMKNVTMFCYHKRRNFTCNYK